jgi:methylaspartate ammonia-lyase
MDKETEDAIEKQKDVIIKAVEELQKITKTEILAIEFHLNEPGEKMTIHALVGDEHSPLEDLRDVDEKLH